MFEHAFNTFEGRRVVILKGDLTVQNARKIKDVLVEEIQNNDNLIIEIDDDASLDITLIQILVAARKWADASDRFVCIHNIGDNFESFLRAVGFTLFIEEVKACCPYQSGGSNA